MTKDPHGPYAAIGERIRMMRDAKELTQTALGRLVHAAQPTVSQWEMGTKVPSRATQFRLADALGVERSWLFAEVAGRTQGRAA